MEALPVQWMREVPVVTRVYVLGAVAVAVVAHTGFLSLKPTPWPSNDFITNLVAIFNSGPLSVGLMTNLFMFTQYSTMLETAADSTWDFAWTLSVILTLLMTYSNLIHPFTFPSGILRDVLLYIWSKNEPEVDIAIFGLITFKSKYFPFVALFLSRMIDSQWINKPLTLKLKTDFVGIIIGHIYWFVNNELPRLHNIKSPFLPVWKYFETEQEQQHIVPEQNNNDDEHNDNDSDSDSDNNNDNNTNNDVGDVDDVDDVNVDEEQEQEQEHQHQDEQEQQELM